MKTSIVGCVFLVIGALLGNFSSQQGGLLFAGIGIGIWMGRILSRYEPYSA